MRHPRRLSPQTKAVILSMADGGDRWRHGYELCTELGLKAGTVYPILIRLADRGLVDATWEKSGNAGRPPRHLYRLSAAGVELARQVRDETASARRAAAAPVEPWARPAGA